MGDDQCIVDNPDCGVYSICDACARAIGEPTLDLECVGCGNLQCQSCSDEAIGR